MSNTKSKKSKRGKKKPIRKSLEQLSNRLDKLSLEIFRTMDDLEVITDPNWRAYLQISGKRAMVVLYGPDERGYVKTPFENAIKNFVDVWRDADAAETEMPIDGPLMIRHLEWAIRYIKEAMEGTKDEERTAW